MDGRVRLAQVSDAAGIVVLGREIDPNTLATEASFRLLLEQGAGPNVERLVAERGARIVAWAPSGMYESGDAWFWIGVERRERGQGLGGQLYERIEKRVRALDATSLATTPNDDDGRRFLLGRGFERANVVRNSELDPRSVAPPAKPPGGITVVTLREAAERTEDLFRMYAEAREDVPSATPRPPLSFEEWGTETIDSPLIDLDASVVVLDDDEPVALAWLYSDRAGNRAEALMSATRRDRRGQGLATLAKIESARRAASLGITRIRTSNDLGNEPMLAVNRKLGFTATGIVESFSKRLFEP